MRRGFFLTLERIRGETMQRTVLSALMLGLFVFCFDHVLLASEADELRQRAKAMRKEAEHLQRESAEMMEAAERLQPNAKERGDREDNPGIDKEVRGLKGRLQDLLAREREMREARAPEQELDEVRQQIAGVEREIHHIRSRHAEPMERPEIRAQVEKLEIAGRRIHQMRVAAEHLKAAEQHDLAHEVMKKAEAMERDVHAAKERMAAEIHEAHRHREDQLPKVVRELREEIERLRAEVRELSERVEKR